jgi:hypothetical protein
MRGRALVLGLLLLAGCGAMKRFHDRMVVRPLTPSPYHEQLTEKPQCLHCHTQLGGAPAVPHPDYDRCADCHRAG